jgi:hypothetical protein
MSFQQPLSHEKVTEILKSLALKAFDLHASSAWGSPEGFALNMAVAVADQLIAERDQREQLLTLLADPKFSQRVKLSPYPAPGSASADKWCAFIWTTDIWEHGADREYFALTDVPALMDLWAKYGYIGLLAWVGAKRDKEPGSFLYPTTAETRAAYSEAWDYLKLNADAATVSRVQLA